MQREEIIRCLQATERQPLSAEGDGHLNPGADYRAVLTPAAVLLGVVERPGQKTILLTQRTAHLNDHAGQISFPGGKCEALDTSPENTALRETHEEVGIEPHFIETLGRLPDYRTFTGFRITPVVAAIEPGFTLRPDPFEVDHAFEIPLDFVLEETNFRIESRVFKGEAKRFFVLPYQDYYIWGATAGMLHEFCERMHVA